MLDYSDRVALTRQHDLQSMQIISTRDLSALQGIDNVDYIDHQKGSDLSYVCHSCAARHSRPPLTPLLSGVHMDSGLSSHQAAATVLKEAAVAKAAGWVGLRLGRVRSGGLGGVVWGRVGLCGVGCVWFGCIGLDCIIGVEYDGKGAGAGVD